MRRGVVSTAVITAVTAALALSGCNSHSTSGASGAPANPNAPTGADVAWVNKFCGAIVSFTAAAGQPDVNMQDPKQAKVGLDAYLARISTALGSSTTDLHKLGKSPEPGGDQVASNFANALTGMRQTVDGARTTLGTADPNNPQQFASTFKQIGQQLGKLNIANPAKGLAQLPRFNQAAQQAPSCVRISHPAGGSNSGGGSSSAAPTS